MQVGHSRSATNAATTDAAAPSLHSPEADADIRAQQDFYTAHKDELRRRYPNAFLVVSDRKVYVGDSWIEAYEEMQAANPGRRFFASWPPGVKPPGGWPWTSEVRQ